MQSACARIGEVHVHKLNNTIEIGYSCLGLRCSRSVGRVLHLDMQLYIEHLAALYLGIAGSRALSLKQRI